MTSKPSNILVTAEAMPKMLDFGIAKSPAINIILPPKIESTSDIEGRIADCDKLFNN